MYRKGVCIIGLVIVCLGCPRFITSATAATAQSDDRASREAMLEWLALVDEGEYKQSWEEACSYFRMITPRELWVSQISAVREPLGGRMSRDMVSNEYQEFMPGAPDGEYYVARFKTIFEHKASATETVTMVKDNDGQWRLAGYYIN